MCNCTYVNGNLTYSRNKNGPVSFYKETDMHSISHIDITTVKSLI